MDTVEQHGRHRLLAPGQVRPPDRADEQGIAGDHEPGLFTATLVGNQQTDAVQGVARRVQHLDDDVAGLDHVVVVQRMERKFHEFGIALVQAVVRASQLRESAAAGIMIGMYVRVDHVRDRDLGLFGLIDKPLLVARDHVHRHRLAAAATAQEVREC